MSANPTASQWQTSAGNLGNLSLVRDVPLGSLEAAQGPSNAVPITTENNPVKAPTSAITEPAPSAATASSTLPTPLATIAVTHIGLNFADMFACLGLYSATPKGTFVPGLEFSGVIEAVNEEAGGAVEGIVANDENFLGDASGRGYKVGDRVFGVTRFGGYTTRLHADTRYIRRLPKGYGLEQGAALPAQALTAWYGLVELGGVGVGVAPPGDSSISALHRIKAKKRKVALIHSGGGGTGMWCIHICRYFNVDVVTTVGSARKKTELLNQFGPEGPRPLAATGQITTSVISVIDRSSCDSSDAARRLAIQKSLGEIVALRSSSDSTFSSTNALGFDYVFDSLQGPWFQPSYDAMRAQGRHMVLGAGSMTPHGSSVNWVSLGYKYLTRSTVDPLAMMSLNKAVMGFNLIWLFDNVEEVGEYLTALMHMIQTSGVSVASIEGSDDAVISTTTALLPTVGHLYPKFVDLPAALKEFQSGSTMGKVVVSTAE